MATGLFIRPYRLPKGGIAPGSLLEVNLIRGWQDSHCRLPVDIDHHGLGDLERAT